jgi:hypothetical protein
MLIYWFEFPFYSSRHGRHLPLLVQNVQFSCLQLIKAQHWVVVDLADANCFVCKFIRLHIHLILEDWFPTQIVDQLLVDRLVPEGIFEYANGGEEDGHGDDDQEEDADTLANVSDTGILRARAFDIDNGTKKDIVTNFLLGPDGGAALRKRRPTLVGTQHGDGS